MAMSYPQAPFRNYTGMEEACSAPAGSTPPGRRRRACRAWRNSCWGSCISWWAKVMGDPMGCPAVNPSSLLQPWGHIPNPPGSPEGQLVWVLHNHMQSPAHGILFPPVSLQVLHQHRHQGVMKASRVAGSSMTFPLLKLTGKRDYHYPLLTRPLMMILLLGDWRITGAYNNTQPELLINP